MMITSELMTPDGWSDYELVDCGGFEKLERFGRYLVARPEPQAVWDKSLGDREWLRRADANFRRDPRGLERSGDRGNAPAVVDWLSDRIVGVETAVGAHLIQTCGRFSGAGGQLGFY